MSNSKKNFSNILNNAVLFLVFNRPDTTSLVFDKIRKAKPSRFYIACDGPREDYLGEKEKVKKVREIVTNVDWSCEIKTLFRDKNLGCKKGVSSAITWFFEHESQGIILEDDCLPHPDFFVFCDILLNHYCDDKRISIITGNNFQYGLSRGEASYYFSKYNHCWGWASWRRAWRHYQGDIEFWPEWRDSKSWINYMPDKIEQKYWRKIFDLVYEKKIDSWAYPWTCCNWKEGKISIAPNVNLVSNIGFREDATHTKYNKHPSSKLKTFGITNLKHPIKIERNIEADSFDFENHFGGKYHKFPFSILRLFKSFLKKI